jgi:hypothetical protein
MLATAMKNNAEIYAVMLKTVLFKVLENLKCQLSHSSLAKTLQK